MSEHNVKWTELRELCQKLMMEEKMSEEDAFICADNLVDADLCGVESHGVSRMTNYMKRLRTGVVDSKGRCRTEKEYPGSLYVNGGNAMGMIVGNYTMGRCIEKARESGCCFATASNSNHFGMAAYYVRMAAEAGMIGIAGTNAPPNLAPWGSPQKYMGTNPIAFGAPTSDIPVILDMAPSVVAMGKIILAAKLGKKIPEGWVVTKEGLPTTDPVVGQYGTLVPIGGAKGSGLAIFMEIFCGILAGAAVGPHINHFWNDFEHPQNVGHFFCAVDIDKFVGLDRFKENIDQIIGEMKALPKNPGVEEIYMPGEIETRKRQDRRANGIQLSDSVYEELRVLAEQYHVDFTI
ncbi:MAG: Ldh family oxidoreductase [Enterocloster sp.]